jgi:hypothetical protein
MQSTAYSTGKSLVALHLAGLPASSPAYQRGVKWLLHSQQEDGSWYVQTRALGFQPWFDAGFPHGPDQWISAAGTNWAAMALTYAIPEKATKAASVARKSPVVSKSEQVSAIKPAVPFPELQKRKRKPATSTFRGKECRSSRAKSENSVDVCWRRHSTKHKPVHSRTPSLHFERRYSNSYA